MSPSPSPLAGQLLKFVRSVNVRFYPFHPSAVASRELLTRLAAPNVRRSNPTCPVDVQLTNDGEAALVQVRFADASEETLRPGELSADEMVERISAASERIYWLSVARDFTLGAAAGGGGGDAAAGGGGKKGAGGGGKK